MPTTYAHYTFGMKVSGLLDHEAKTVVNRHMPLFLVGLHGPDILFYYKPLKSNEIVHVGHEIHRRKALEFFDRAKDKLAECRDTEAGIAYLLGFFCHFMLDSECHPLVRYKTKTDDLAHNKLEREFDRVMMTREDLDPLSYNPTAHLVLSKADTEIIACLYPGISPEVIAKSVRDMKRYLEFLVTPGKLKNTLLLSAFKLIGPGKGFEGLLMSWEPLPQYIDSSNELADTLYHVVEPTAMLANVLFRYLRTDPCIGSDEVELKQRLNRNFG